MRSIRFRALVIVGLILTVGISTAFADEKRKRPPKGMGTLAVKTAPVAYKVKIDGQDAGMSGTYGDGAEFYLTPGFHTVEVIGPDGSIFVKEVEIRKGYRHCVCLKLVEETIEKPCPYRFTLEGPERITEGDLVTFAAIPTMTSPIPVRYQWRVSPSAARITSGLGTPTITIDSQGLGGQTIEAELDVNDDVYDNRCRQVITVPTEVSRIPPPEKITRILCDEFPAKSADDDKARFDNCVIQAQNTPDSQLYIIIYPGTDRASRTRNTYERLSKRALDYIVRNRGYDPSRIRILRGPTRAVTTYEIIIVPAGAEPPVVP